MSDLKPFDEDTPIALAAERAGMVVYRRPVVRITDVSAIPESLKRKSPDYPKIRKLIEDGVSVPGAEMTTEVEYILRKPEPSTEGT